MPFYFKALSLRLSQEEKSTALHLLALPTNTGQTAGRRF